MDCVKIVKLNKQRSLQEESPSFSFFFLGHNLVLVKKIGLIEISGATITLGEQIEAHVF